ncbi:MAG: hypothetical protein P8X46_09270, partial [Nitrospirales bacterium]
MPDGGHRASIPTAVLPDVCKPEFIFPLFGWIPATDLGMARKACHIRQVLSGRSLSSLSFATFVI